MIRINQIYEQAKWSLISEELECTEEEMMMFSALQVNINYASHLPHSASHIHLPYIHYHRPCYVGGGGGDGDLPACGLPASFYVHLVSSAVTPAGSPFSASST